MFQSVYNSLVDSGANRSCIDEAVVHELGLTIKPAKPGQSIQLAHANTQLPRIGTVDIPVQFLFPSSIPARQSLSMTHSFEVLPVYNERCDYHVILGTDVIPLLFPHGVPLEYISTGFRTQLSPSLSALLSSGNDDDSPTVLSSVVCSDSSDCDGVAALDEREQKTKVSTPQLLESEYAPRRALLLSNLEDCISANAQVQGFCNLTESVVHLQVDESRRNSLYRKQYKIPHVLMELATPIIMDWFDTGKIELADPRMSLQQCHDCCA